MPYGKSSTTERAALMRSLAAMPAYLRQRFAPLTCEQARIPGPGGAFSPLEHVWHLADLEREGFAVRIGRLRDEESPRLQDFNGARIARERDYRSRLLREGLEAFAAARKANIAALESLPGEAWTRTGTQEGVGAVSLGDMPALMSRHDEEHRAEIEEWERCQT